MSCPSTDALRITRALSGALFRAQSRRASSVVRERSSAVEHSVFRSGKKIAFEDGTVQVRSTVPPVLPAKYQTSGSSWLTPQSSPVGSKTGLLSIGSLCAHSHHNWFHSPYVLPYGLEFGGKTVTVMSWSFAESSRFEFFFSSLLVSM